MKNTILKALPYIMAAAAYFYIRPETFWQRIIAVTFCVSVGVAVFMLDEDRRR